MSKYKDWHPNFPPDLENCHEEPIGVPGAIQTFGILVGFDADRKVQVYSDNAPQILKGLENFGERNLLIDDLLSIREVADVVATAQENGRRLVTVNILSGDQSSSYLGAIHRSGGLEILEIETEATTFSLNAQAYLSNMPRMMNDIRGFKTIRELADFTAKRVRSITGFDRVMVYEFDPGWNGEVIAEAKSEKLDSLLGMHFPHSDIPPQARNLYARNWIRIIPTIEYRPAILKPKRMQNLDLADSTLRSVSPIHIEYLKNMGVRASMSISLIVDGKLWGLIACHHYSDHLVPLDLRFGCEAYGQLVSWYIKSITSTNSIAKVQSGEQRLHRVLRAFTDEPNFIAAAKSVEPDLLGLFESHGMLIRLGEETVSLGLTPDEGTTKFIARTLDDYSILEPLVTNELQTLFSVPEQAEVGGIMALPLAPRHNYYILCVRKEVKQTISWAGDPNLKGKTDFKDPKQRLIPRGSFELWKELHEGQCEHWSPDTIDLFKRFGLLFVKIVIERKELVQKSNNELMALNRSKDEFVAMVSHELRTPLNAIIGWTELAISGELPGEKVGDALKIIQRNARSQNQLISDLLDVSRIISGKLRLSVKNIRVSEIVEAVVLSFLPAADAKGIKIITHLDHESDSIIGDPSRIQQVVWNLLSNAVKFAPKHTNIWASVKRVNSHIEIAVKDQGTGLESKNLEKIFARFEQVDSSTTKKFGGLGLGLAISKHIVELHGGSIWAESEGLGHGATLVAKFPIGPVSAEEDSGRDLPIDDNFFDPADKAKKSERLKGEVILIVEDEQDAINFLELLIKNNGAKTFTARDGQEALKVLEENCDEIGIVLSDIGMPTMDGHHLAQAIRASANPKINSLCMIALTAFGRAQDRIIALRSGFDSYIAKPVMQEELLTVLEAACKGNRRGR